MRHWRAGTLGKRVAAHLGRRSADDKVRWFGADTEAEALQALLARTRRGLADTPGKQALVIGDNSDFQRQLCTALTEQNLAHSALTLDQALALNPDETQCFALVLCADLATAKQTRAARELAAHAALGRLTFEHAPGLDASRKAFHHLDEYAHTDFASPVLLEAPGPYAIYQESLQHFEQKCGLRDYLDLYQLLKSVVERDVPGDIAEFGSFRGHSGWLIARSLQALGSDKRVFMFDTFDSFPQENYGVDHFWSATHPVNYEQVKAKFEAMPQVTLVKGDFTQTLADSPVTELALAFIDCDSYRATRYLLQTLPQDYLQPHGVLVCEDYGHPALLGNRVAVHEVLDGQTGWFKYFSQFSGLYIAVKMQES